MKIKNKKKTTKIEKNVKHKAQIQCFLAEKPMFYLERQNRKNEKMKNGNRKSQNFRNNKNIKSHIQCFLEENICFSFRDKILNMEKY